MAPLSQQPWGAAPRAKPRSPFMGLNGDFCYLCFALRLPATTAL